MIAVFQKWNWREMENPTLKESSLTINYLSPGLELKTHTRKHEADGWIVCFSFNAAASWNYWTWMKQWIKQPQIKFSP